MFFYELTKGVLLSDGGELPNDQAEAEDIFVEEADLGALDGAREATERSQDQANLQKARHRFTQMIVPDGNLMVVHLK